MADFITRILLDDKQFNNNIEKSKYQFDRFKKSGQDANLSLQNVVGTFGKLAGALGVAYTAGEAFNKTIASSQTLTDEWGKATQQAKTAVNEFFYSIGSGDFTTFSGGLATLINQAEALYKALDQLGNTKMSYSYFSDKFDTNIETARTAALDPSATAAEKEAAMQQWQAAIRAKKEASETLSADLLESLRSTLVTGTQLNKEDVGLSDFENVLKLDIANPAERERLKEVYARQYSQYVTKFQALEKQKKSAATDKLFPESAGAKERAAFDEKIVERQQALNAEYKDAIIFNQALVKWKDEDLQKTIDLGREYNGITRQLAQNQNTYNRAEGRVLGTAAPKPTKVEKDIDVKFNIHYTNVDDLFNPEGVIQKLNRQKLTIQPLIEVEEDNPIEAPFDEKAVKDNFNYAESLMAINTAMNAMGRATEDSAAAWLSYSAGIIGGVAAMLPSLASLFKFTAALGIAEQSKIPFPMNIVALTATSAALGASIAALPKFADGGVVKGASNATDSTMCLLKSGELVLNGRQQSNLFALLNNDNAGTVGGGKQQVEFRIKGRNLEGIMQKNSNLNKRLR